MRERERGWYLEQRAKVSLAHASPPPRSPRLGPKDPGMPTFYFRGHGHTLACALREALEELTDEDEFVSCTVMHPLDTHLEVVAPSERLVREALLLCRERLASLPMRWKESVGVGEAATRGRRAPTRSPGVPAAR
jgi:DNA-directed RNA polymerase subunit L